MKILTLFPYDQYCVYNNFQQGWCDSPGTVSEVRAKLEMRQRANIKRERAIAYSFSQQVIMDFLYFFLVKELTG